MPQLGETVTEGKITKWFKTAGDAVKPGDNLFEIETDKTSMEVPSTTTGTLAEIRFKVGEVAKVGRRGGRDFRSRRRARSAGGTRAGRSPGGSSAPCTCGGRGSRAGGAGPANRADGSFSRGAHA